MKPLDCMKEGGRTEREKCIICGRVLPEEGSGICADCIAEKSDEETAEELRDIESVLEIMDGTDIKLKKSMEAIMRIAYKMERRNKE